MPSGNSGNNNNGGGASGNSGTDYGALIEDIGGLVGDIFDGNFWEFISQFGCMSSSFKLKFLKDHFPRDIDLMRVKSGVNVAMNPTNMNEFSKRLYHLKTAMIQNGGGGCRGAYSKKYAEMLGTYIGELENLVTQSGLGKKGQESVTNYNQSDINQYMFPDSVSFTYPTYEFVDNLGGGSDYTTIGGSDYEGGGIFGGGTFSPTLNKVSGMNWAIGLTIAYMGYMMMKDNKNFKKLLK